MKDIFQLRISGRPVRMQHRNNLTVKTRKTVTFGTNSISSLGPKIWNSLVAFKQMIKKWDGTKCLCDECNRPF